MRVDYYGRIRGAGLGRGGGARGGSARGGSARGGIGIGETRLHRRV